MPAAAHAIEVHLAWETIDKMVCQTMARVGFAAGDIEAAIMTGIIGPMSRIKPPCSHERWDENAVARVCLSCKRVLQVKPPPLP